MSLKRDDIVICLVGASSEDAQIAEQFAVKIGWSTKAFVGSPGCIPILLAHRPLVVFVDINGVQTYAPKFVADLRLKNDDTAIVAYGGLILPGLVDQLTRAGAEVLVTKQSLASLIEQFSKSMREPVLPSNNGR